MIDLVVVGGGQAGLAAGARAYLRKPFRAEQLWEVIDSVMSS